VFIHTVSTKGSTWAYLKIFKIHPALRNYNLEAWIFIFKKLTILVKISAISIEILTFVAHLWHSGDPAFYKLLNNNNNNYYYYYLNGGVSKVYRFQKRSMKLTDVSIDCSVWSWDCRYAESWNFGFHITFAMTSKQPWFQTGGLCNLGPGASARLPHANPWRRPPRWATRGGTVRIWPRDHQCCSYSLASIHWRVHMRVCVWRQTEDILNIFMTIDEWSHCFIGDNWTCSLCCHGNLCFWRVIENI